MSLWTMYYRCWRLRCPRCGRSRQFRGWFTNWPKCSECGLPFEREPGFYLGSIYINYGLTALLTTVSYVVLNFVYEVPQKPLLAGMTAFCVLFPVWFFRYARSLWLGMDEFIDPDSEKKKPGQVSVESQAEPASRG